jgi:NAD dependent epimerase/dehydratase family enzyme
LKFGVAAILGNGKQKISWIDIDDLCTIYINAIENNNWHGSYNAVAPSPISNKQLTLALAKKLRGKFFIPIYVPGFVLNFILGEMSIEVLKSCTVSAEKIKHAGYNFLYPTLESSLDHLLKK